MTVANHRFHEFESGALRISTRLELKPNADRLTVLMNAYRSKSNPPPVFHSWPPIPESLGHVLRVSDPTFFLDDQLENCAFLGSERNDPVPPIVDYSRKLAAKLGIAPERTIYFGFSGAALGAIRCALEDGRAVGIGVNPSLEVGAYAHFSIAKDYSNMFRPGAAIKQLCEEYPHRFSATAASLDALAKGRRPRVGLIQNSFDLLHYKYHLGHLCNALAIPLAGGSDPTGCFRVFVFEKEGGHLGLPEMSLVEQVIEELLGQRARGEHRTGVLRSCALFFRALFPSMTRWSGRPKPPYDQT